MPTNTKVVPLIDEGNSHPNPAIGHVDGESNCKVGAYDGVAFHVKPRSYSIKG
jgi:hypothetical protein